MSNFVGLTADFRQSGNSVFDYVYVLNTLYANGLNVGGGGSSASVFKGDVVFEKDVSIGGKLDLL